jgi:D-arabinose 1-dehydrogenase-like Zn-dependent alcohol dehydrogenase
MIAGTDIETAYARMLQGRRPHRFVIDIATLAA